MKVVEKMEQIKNEVVLPGALSVCEMAVSKTVDSCCLFFCGQPKEPEELKKTDLKKMF
ncbi:hypothetical protein lbkm_2609 [Lachnospiraceae bacterium KM106-2]|nr:hypothetical protein lbkm_2609 [Lachnospiraceae bacterium KM106-2]